VYISKIVASVPPLRQKLNGFQDYIHKSNNNAGQQSVMLLVPKISLKIRNRGDGRIGDDEDEDSEGQAVPLQNGILWP